MFRARLDSTSVVTFKQRQQVSASFESLDDARSWVSEVRMTVRTNGAYGLALRAASGTVRQLAERWVATRVDVRRVTREGCRQWLAPVLRHTIASQPVSEVTIADMQELVSWLAREGMRPRKGRNTGTPLSPSSIRSVKVALRQAFDLAVAEGTLDRNVVTFAKWPKSRTKRGRDLEHWQPEELVKFRGHADGDALAGAWRLTLSGMTRGDIMGLRWSDIDLAAGVASVSVGRVAVEDGRTVVDIPKSAQRVRAVPFEAIHVGSIPLL